MYGKHAISYNSTISLKQLECATLTKLYPLK